MKRFYRMIAFIIIFTMLFIYITPATVNVNALVNLSGSGTTEDPYVILTLDDLIEFSDIVKTDYAACAILMADIIGSGSETIDSIGAEGYSGTFNGNFHKIAELSVNHVQDGEGEKYGGLFANLKSGAVIKNLSVKLDLSLCSGDNTGVLAGEVDNGALIYNCHVLSGSILGNIVLGINGGLVGLNKGTISGSSSRAQVTSGSVMGGFVGENQGTITACWANPVWVLASIKTYGSPDADDNFVGGFAGINSGEILACIANYCGVSVSGDRCTIGGFIGENQADGIIDACLSLTDQNSGSGTDVLVGGFAGNNEGIVTASYFNKINVTSTTSPQAIGMGINEGITAGGYELLSADSFTGSERWNFNDADAKEENGVIYKWIAPGGSVYPKLEITISESQIGDDEQPQEPVDPDPRPEGVLVGEGTDEVPYEISTYDDLLLFAWLTRNDPLNINAYAVLKADIDAGGQTFIPAGNALFGYGGVFDGSNFTISNISFDSVTDVAGISYSGLFSSLSQGSVLKNIKLSANSNISADFAGLLAGYADKARIVNCHILGGSSLSNAQKTNINPSGPQIMINSGNTGALIGANYLGLITGCTATADVDGGDNIGGLIGYNDGIVVASGTINTTVSNSNGTQSANTYAGGFIGENNGILASVYVNNSTLYSTGTMNSANGGLVGRNSEGGIISTAYADIEIHKPSSFHSSAEAASLAAINMNRITASYVNGRSSDLKPIGVNGKINVATKINFNVSGSFFEGSNRWSFSSAAPVSEYSMIYHWVLANNIPHISMISIEEPALPSEGEILSYTDSDSVIEPAPYTPTTPTSTQPPSVGNVYGSTITDLSYTLDDANTAKVTVPLTLMSQAVQSGGSSILIDASNTISSNCVQVTIPSVTADMMQDKSIEQIVVDTGVSQVTIGVETFSRLSAGASEFTVEIERVDNESLSEEIQKIVGDKPIFDFNLYADGKKLLNASFSHGDVIVSIDYTLQEGEDPNKIVIYYINDSGEVEVVKDCKYDALTGKVIFMPKHFSKYFVNASDVTINDMNSTQWALEHAEFLVARGILPLSEGNHFEPLKNVTRSDFVKIVINAFGHIDDTATSTFSDVTSDNPDYKYIATAQKIGLIQGYKDRFNPDDYLTRQHAVLIIHRALKIYGIELVLSRPDIMYTDNGLIWEATVEPLSILTQAGVIEGYNRIFSPNESLNRAQLAKILSTILKQKIK